MFIEILKKTVFKISKSKFTNLQKPEENCLFWFLAVNRTLPRAELGALLTAVGDELEGGAEGFVVVREPGDAEFNTLSQKRPRCDWRPHSFLQQPLGH